MPENTGHHMELREDWLTWMACTSKMLQTVDNKHLNRHLDYMRSGPTVNFVDMQTTPQLGRRLEAVGHIVECINVLGEFPLDCVVPTPQTELLMGKGKSSKLVRGVRMKNQTQRAEREPDVMTAETDARHAEKWLKNFRRGLRQRPQHHDFYM